MQDNTNKHPGEMRKDRLSEFLVHDGSRETRHQLIAERHQTILESVEAKGTSIQSAFQEITHLSKRSKLLLLPSTERGADT